MGWVEYIVNEDKKIAIEISRHTAELDVDDGESIRELFQYIGETEKLNLDVIGYILDKGSYLNYDEIILTYMKSKYNFNKRIHEDELPNDYLILNR